MVREFLAVAARAALQWALATALLANGAAFCLIAAAASRLRLGPPCLLCVRVHRLLSSSSSDAGQEGGAFRRLLCDAHAAAVAGTAAPTTERRPTCSAPDRADEGSKGAVAADDSDKLRGLEANRVVSIGSEICEQDHAGDGERHRVSVARNSSIDNDDPYVSLFELAPIVEVPQGNSGHVQELGETGMPGEAAAAGAELRETVERLAAALRAQRGELEALREELDGERRASAEASERRRQLEEQSEFDREAARLAMQLVHEAETEKHGLQRQLDACRVKAQLYESSMDAAAPTPSIRPEANGNGNDDGGGGNNYQSLVDFLPGSVYSSSPDLANMLKLHTEGNDALRRRDGQTMTNTSGVAVVTEEEEAVVAEEEAAEEAVVAEEAEAEEAVVAEEAEAEEAVVAVTATAVSDSAGNGDTLTAGSNEAVEPTEAASLQ